MGRNVQNGFDRLAPYYDRLAKFIFGSHIRKSQLSLLHRLDKDSRVLVLGGGTGWIIPEILKIQAHCDIYFVDLSGEMIRRAREANPNATRVTFIQGTAADVYQMKFDFIILPFYLDLFSTETLRDNLLLISRVSSKTTRWLVTDFINHGKWWEKFLLTMMYQFFKITCRIEAQKLPPWDDIMINLGFLRQEVRTFYRGFIESHSYVKA